MLWCWLGAAPQRRGGMHRLCTNLSYRAEEIDAFLDERRNEGEVRLVCVRAAIRAVATKLQRPALVDAHEDGSLADMLISTRDARAGAFASIMVPGGCARACLVHPTVKLITPSQADELDEPERAKCVPLQASDRLAVRDEDEACDAQVLVSVPSCECGGGRDGLLIAARRGEQGIELMVRSAGGKRRSLSADGLPRSIVDRLFVRGDDVPVSPLPWRRNHLPEFLKAPLADFLQRRVRLQVLCTARMPSPVSRPVALDRVFLKKLDEKARSRVVVEANLHASSASCICGLHRRFPEWGSRVAITFEACGRVLTRDVHHSGMQCGLHAALVDASGNARNRVKSYCTEDTRVCVSCCHKNGRDESEKTICVPSVRLSAAVRRELALVLVTMLEFEDSTARFYTGQELTDPSGLEAAQEKIKTRFEHDMASVRADQLAEGGAYTERELLERDSTAVDMLRKGGVLKRVYKKGTKQAGHPYLRRAAGGAALQPRESAIADTHAHLFRVQS